MKISIKKVTVLRVKGLVDKKIFACFVHQNSDISEFVRLCKKIGSSPFSEPLFSVSGRLITSNNVPHEKFRLLEKDFFKLFFEHCYLNQNIDSPKNRNVLSMLNYLDLRIHSSLLMQASLLPRKSQSVHLRWKN